MTQTSHLKSAQITALEAVPYGDVLSAGLGAPARLVVVHGTAIPLAADAAGSTYQLCRVPSTAVIKRVMFGSQAQGAGTFDISVYYSSSTIDGTAQANATTPPTVVPTTGATFIADAIVCASAFQYQDVLGYGGTAAGWTLGMINKRLWDALALTTDPGGYLDIVAVCTDTAVTTGTGIIAMGVEYAE